MDKEISKKKEKRTRKKTGKKKTLLLSIAVCIVLALGMSFSWYRFSIDNHADTYDVEIMTPYFLYLLNPDDTTSLQFSVGNIHPGETKKIVICVSNKRPSDVQDDSIDIARQSKFSYDLEFIHTENLKVNYDIYELEKSSYENISVIPDEGIVVDGVSGYYWTIKPFVNEAGETLYTPLEITKDVTDTRIDEVFQGNSSGVFNKGKYYLYQYDRNGDEMALEYKYENDQWKYEFDYYLIEISWQDGVNFSEYTKETDLLYVVVNAKQPKPIEKS